MRNTLFSFACPQCLTPLEPISQDAYRCPTDLLEYRRVDGIWQYLPPTRIRHYQQFIREYETIRAAEGRGSKNPTYYQALPFKDISGQSNYDWKIRAKSYQSLLKHVIQSSERNVPLRILDLGAGNCWLSYRLALRSHLVAAVDLLTNSLDGLGVHVHYPAEFTPVQAEFNHLPFTPEQFDLAIFNASFHYSVSYFAALDEALRCLKPNGQIVILDSPIYSEAGSGIKMVSEREANFSEAYGFPSNAISSENFLTYQRLDELGQELGLRWDLYKPFYNLKWSLRPLQAKLLGRREPAQFLVITGRHTQS